MRECRNVLLPCSNIWYCLLDTRSRVPNRLRDDIILSMAMNGPNWVIYMLIGFCLASVIYLIVGLEQC